ncbi:nitrogen fixation protein NifZ [Rhodovulum strictum]|uniref:Nitrogen fixation protein NifZ n=1 Tax=Rhodovulum strictum TaxID=58314 RepID=A0A844BMH5_9RHOB|nr:nitrogen fixation protein NifZ [Rhodovulum strictum]MRH22925.1 nitrogen fixation protein NifZ [Rhodovulum strictum]
MSSDDREIEIYGPPAFAPGEKVRCLKHIRNDGTVPGREIGEFVVRKGEEGYVRDIGTFLNQFYIYAVDFVDSRAIVGMRRDELVSLEKESAR